MYRDQVNLIILKAKKIKNKQKYFFFNIPALRGKGIMPKIKPKRKEITKPLLRNNLKETHYQNKEINEGFFQTNEYFYNPENFGVE